MQKKMYFVLFVVAVFSLMLAVGNAAIIIHEDFEDATPFESLNWTITSDVEANDNGLPPSTVGRGINVRAYSNAYIANPETVVGRSPALQLTHNGAVVSSRRFLGTQSYKLEPGQSIATVDGTVPVSSTNHNRVWQFAISTDADAAQEAVGTVIGTFTIRYANSQANFQSAVVDDTVTINIVVAANEVIRLVCVENGALLGEMFAGSGHWSLLTLVHQQDLTTNVPWKAYRPSDDIYLGPQPSVIPPTVDAHYFGHPAGVHIYVNGRAAATHLAPGAPLAAEWGGGGEAADSTYERGWTLAAVNGAVYVDSMFSNAGLFNNQNWVLALESSERMLDFDVATTEPMGASVGESWLLY